MFKIFMIIYFTINFIIMFFKLLIVQENKTFQESVFDLVKFSYKNRKCGVSLQIFLHIRLVKLLLGKERRNLNMYYILGISISKFFPEN